MGNKISNTKCYILDEFHNKHFFQKYDLKIYQNQAFIFFKTKKPFYTKDIQLFIYKIGKNNIINYLANKNINLENLDFIKNHDIEYYEFVEETLEYKISIRLNTDKKITTVVIKFKSKELYKYN